MKHFKSISSVVVSAVLLSSCLKEHDTNVSIEDTTATFLSLTFPKENSSTVNSGAQYFNNAGLQYSADAASAEETFVVKVNGAGDFKSDVTAKVSANASKISDNTDGVEYELMPDSCYVINNASIVIPAGSRTATGSITFFPNKIDPTHVYVLPLELSDAGGTVIASNINTIYFRVALKNRYDGVYTLQLRLEGWLAYGIASGISGTYPGDIELTTNQANSVTHFQTYYNNGSDFQPGFTGTEGAISGNTAFGAASPEYVFDNATNLLIDVKNTYPDDGRGRAFALNPAVATSRFDPDTRTIYAAYLFKQTGRPDMEVYDTLTYKGER